MGFSAWRQTWAERSGTDPDFPVGVVQVSFFDGFTYLCWWKHDVYLCYMIGYKCAASHINVGQDA